LFIVNAGGVQSFSLDRSFLFASEHSQTSHPEKTFIKQALGRSFPGKTGSGTFVAISVTALCSDPKTTKRA
jgi:hypothetical protein